MSRRYFASQVRGDGYTDVCPCDDERDARLTARDLSLSGVAVAVLVEPGSEGADREEIARFEGGEQLVPSDETERVTVRIEPAGRA